MEKYPLRAQLLSCLAMSLIALAIIYFAQDVQWPGFLLAGLPWRQQMMMGLTLGVLVGGVSTIMALRKPNDETVRRTSASYARLDLRGLNPVWISLGAGISEELLFRAALQPLLGIWLTTLLFLLVHAGAYDFRRLDRAALWQAGGVVGMSLMFGFAYEYTGLATVIVAHVVIDIFGLYSVRRLAAGQAY